MTPNVRTTERINTLPAHSPLPEFNVRHEVPGLIHVGCRRCQADHVVDEDAWRLGLSGVQGSFTRPCPYCFKVSKIPAR